MTLEQALPKVADALRWLIIAGIAWTIASTILSFLGGPATSADAPADSSDTSAAPRAVNVQAIAARNLFGDASGFSAPVAREETPRETTLALVLSGVFEAEIPEESAAIVSEKGKPGKLYQVGEAVQRNVELVEVHSDYVVLSRAGSREILRFAESAAAFASARRDTDDAGRGARRASGVAANAIEDDDDLETFAELLDNQNSGESVDLEPTSPREFLEANAQLLENDPSAVLSQYGIEPVADGSASGYRVSDQLAQSPYLSQAGLQSGDIIMSVNGQPVGNVSTDRAEIANVMAQGSARLEIQRGSRRFFVTASLKD
ncbi:MAG: PDZ domain-containing protein [Pseudomonadaceae bacterium]|nr:PDZ domain-containing protein [Pseudomonadaceae bacterium]